MFVFIAGLLYAAAMFLWSAGGLALFAVPLWRIASTAGALRYSVCDAGRLAERHCRANGTLTASAAAVTVAVLVALSLIAFESAPWLALPGQIENVLSIMREANQPQRLPSLYGLGLSLNLPTYFGSAAQSMLAPVVVAAISSS